MENKKYNFAWKLKNSWFIIFILSFGILNFIPFFIMAVKVKMKKWSLYGVIYSYAFAYFIAYAISDKIGNIDFLMFLYIVVLLFSTVHVFIVLKKYLSKLMERDVEINEEQVSIGLITLNINIAEEKDIAKLPGIGIKLAKEIVALREKNGGFASMSEFAQALQLDQQEIDDIIPYVTFGQFKRKVNVDVKVEAKVEAKVETKTETKVEAPVQKKVNADEVNNLNIQNDVPKKHNPNDPNKYGRSVDF